MPPSKAEPFPPLRPPGLPSASNRFGPVTLAIGLVSNTGPLSLKKIIIVSSKIPFFSIAFKILPISLSSELILAAYNRSSLFSI